MCLIGIRVWSDSKWYVVIGYIVVGWFSSFLDCSSFQVEIKKEDRNVSGCVRIAVTHEDSCLSITLISADNLVSFDTMTSLNPVVLVYLLPNRG